MTVLSTGMTVDLVSRLFAGVRRSTRGEALAARWLAELEARGVRSLALFHAHGEWVAGPSGEPREAVGDALALTPGARLEALERRVLAELAATAVHDLSRLHRFARASRGANRDRLELRARLSELSGEDLGLLGASEAMQALRRSLRAVAPHPTTVLLEGETGTGKELAARAIHRLSGRTGAFRAINCGALPEALLEAELFGHTAEAFTGARRARPGLFRGARGGTVFLDEIAELPLASQPKLLRVLQEREVTPVGADQAEPVEVRVVAATHRDLRKAAAAGSFRQDLFYRLAVFPLELPALRERPEDLPALVELKLSAICARLGRSTPRVPRAVQRALARHDWPGNVRELENALERAALMSGERLEWSAPPSHESGPESGELESVVRRAIERALRASQGRIYGERGAARALGLPPSTLQTKMKKLGIDRQAFSAA